MVQYQLITYIKIRVPFQAFYKDYSQSDDTVSMLDVSSKARVLIVDISQAK